MLESVTRMDTHTHMFQMNASRRLGIGAIFVMLSLCSGCSTAPSWSTDNDSIEPLLKSSERALTKLKSTDSLYILPDKTQPPAYYVGPHDELLVTLWGNSNLWSELTVHSSLAQHATVVQQDTTVSLPLLDDVIVSGLTVAEISKRLKYMYTRVIDTPFQIEVILNKARSQALSLEGAFTNAGVAYIGPSQQTLGQIISAAGGFIDHADTGNGILTRDTIRYAIDYRGAQEGVNNVHNLVMKPGDTVFFPSQNERVYYVFGEVLRQGAFPIPSQGISLLEGMSKAWGPNIVSGDMEDIYLIRIYDSEKKPVIYNLSMDDIMAHQDIALLPGDRVFIPPTGLANWSRTLNQLFGGTASAGTTLRTFTAE